MKNSQISFNGDGDSHENADCEQNVVKGVNKFWCHVMMCLKVKTVTNNTNLNNVM